MVTKIIKVNPRDIKLLEVNARYMKQEEYKRLVNNVKSDKALSSVPFCCYNEDWELECLSGNHRVMAAIDAGLKEIDVMVTEEELTENQKRAIQISHNAIVGQDDMAVLKELYESIDDVEFKEYSGLDDEVIKALDKIGSQTMSAASLDFQVLSIVVLPDELNKAVEIIEQVKKEIRGTGFTLRFAEYDKWLDTLEVVGNSAGIKNTATVLMAMLELVSHHLDELKDLWIEEADDKQWVPLSTILGRTKVRASDGRIIEKAVKRMIDKQELKKNERHKALRMFAEMYLDENDTKHTKNRKQKK